MSFRPYMNLRKHFEPLSFIARGYVCMQAAGIDRKPA